jgi:hypothetical protein
MGVPVLGTINEQKGYEYEYEYLKLIAPNKTARTILCQRRVWQRKVSCMRNNNKHVLGTNHKRGETQKTQDLVLATSNHPAQKQPSENWRQFVVSYH